MAKGRIHNVIQVFPCFSCRFQISGFCPTLTNAKVCFQNIQREIKLGQLGKSVFFPVRFVFISLFYIILFYHYKLSVDRSMGICMSRFQLTVSRRKNVLEYSASNLTCKCLDRHNRSEAVITSCDCTKGALYFSYPFYANQSQAMNLGGRLA